MENVYGKNQSKLHKLMALSGSVSPINEQRPGFFNHLPIERPSFDSRVNSDIRYLRSGLPASGVVPMVGKQFGISSGGGSRLRGSVRAPLSAIENLEVSRQSSLSKTVFKTPVKLEEDVLVMDGILVEEPVASAGARASLSSDSGGTSSSGGKGFYKREMCWSWEDSGSCRFGAKCQFAHGKEKLRPIRFPLKNKPEAVICKNYSSGSCTYSSKCRFIHHQLNSPTTSTDSISPSFATTPTISPLKPEPSLSSVDSGSMTFSSTDWSPLDDGIEIALPPSTSTDKAPSREEVNAYIHTVLYGPIQKSRLPVFAEICPR